MDLTISASLLPHDDPETSPAFDGDVLGFEVRNDAGNGAMRWVTAGPAGRRGTSVVRDRTVRDPAGSLLRIQEQR